MLSLSSVSEGSRETRVLGSLQEQLSTMFDLLAESFSHGYYSASAILVHQSNLWPIPRHIQNMPSALATYKVHVNEMLAKPHQNHGESNVLNILPRRHRQDQPCE